MLRATRADMGVGNPSASSKALVCSDCVPPKIAAIASMVVRITLLYGSCANVQPKVVEVDKMRGVNDGGEAEMCSQK